MEKIELKKFDDTKLPEKTVTERLPKLDFFQAENASKDIEWANEFMEVHTQGQVKWIRSMGVHLQKVSDDVVRCIGIEDHPHCFFMLSNLACCFEAAQIKLEIDPFTVVIPYTRSESTQDSNDASQDEIGIEVV